MEQDEGYFFVLTVLSGSSCKRYDTLYCSVQKWKLKNDIFLVQSVHGKPRAEISTANVSISENSFTNHSPPENEIKNDSQIPNEKLKYQKKSNPIQNIRNQIKALMERNNFRKEGKLRNVTNASDQVNDIAIKNDDNLSLEDKKELLQVYLKDQMENYVQSDEVLKSEDKEKIIRFYFKDQLKRYVEENKINMERQSEEWSFLQNGVITDFESADKILTPEQKLGLLKIYFKQKLEEFVKNHAELTEADEKEIFELYIKSQLEHYVKLSNGEQVENTDEIPLNFLRGEVEEIITKGVKQSQGNIGLVSIIFNLIFGTTTSSGMTKLSKSTSDLGFVLNAMLSL